MSPPESPASAHVLLQPPFQTRPTEVPLHKDSFPQSGKRSHSVYNYDWRSSRSPPENMLSASASQSLGSPYQRRDSKVHPDTHSKRMNNRPSWGLPFIDANAHTRDERPKSPYESIQRTESASSRHAQTQNNTREHSRLPADMQRLHRLSSTSDHPRDAPGRQDIASLTATTADPRLPVSAYLSREAHYHGEATAQAQPRSYNHENEYHRERLATREPIYAQSHVLPPPRSSHPDAATQHTYLSPPPYDYQGSTSRKRSNLPKQSTEIMKRWFDENIENPYPSEEQKRYFAAAASINLTQVSFSTQR